MELGIFLPLLMIFPEKLGYFFFSKLETFDRFKELKVEVELESNSKVKCIRFDGEGEYMSNEFYFFCKTHGIYRQVIMPYSP